MPRKRSDAFDDYAEEYGEAALDELMDLLEEFPELDDYLSDILEYDDEDFYTNTQ